MNFREYLEKRPVSNNTSGDFIQLARTDSDLANCISLQELTGHMLSKKFSPEATEAGKRVFKSYRDYTGRRHKPAEVAAAH